MFKQWISYLCFFWAFSLLPLQAEIKEISSLQEIEEVDSSTLVLLNLTNTLYNSANTMGNSLWKEFFVDKVHAVIVDPIQADQIANQMKKKIVLVVPKKLFEEDSKDRIASLQAKQIPVVGLTLKHLSRPYAENFGEITKDHLLSLGIDFDKTNQYLDLSDKEDDYYHYKYGIIFTAEKAPGKAVRLFLERMNQSIQKVIVVDNHTENLEDIEESIKETCICKGYCYNASHHLVFKPELGTIQFQEFLRSGKVLSDEEAETLFDPSVDYDALLEELIISLQ